MVKYICIYRQRTVRGDEMSVYTPIVSDAQIVKALEDAFGLRVEYANLIDDSMESYFFYLRESADRIEDKSYFNESLTVGYVSINSANDLTYDIADTLTDIGLVVNGIEFDLIRLTDGKNYADVSLFNCIRRIRRSPANGVRMIGGANE